MAANSKADLRGQMRAIAAGRGSTVGLSGLIAANLRGWAAWERAFRICAFWPLADEPCLLSPWPAGREVALPRVEGGEMRMFFARGPEELVRGAFGVMEPPGGANAASPTGFDLILVPGLAFDRSGGRLGRGRGYYDRFLAAASGLKAGVCFDDQLVGDVPREAHDVAMDVLVTPSGIIACAPKNTG